MKGTVKQYWIILGLLALTLSSLSLFGAWEKDPISKQGLNVCELQQKVDCYVNSWWWNLP